MLNVLVYTIMVTNYSGKAAITTQLEAVYVSSHTTVNRDVTTRPSIPFVSYGCGRALACINGVWLSFDKYRIHSRITIKAIAALTRNAVINADTAIRIIAVEASLRAQFVNTDDQNVCGVRLQAFCEFSQEKMNTSAICPTCK